MALTPIFDSDKAGRPMRVAALMSGSGTNILKLLERERELREQEGTAPFEVVFVFSDRSDGASRGEAIALEHGLPYASYDVRAFHRLRGVRRTVTTPDGMAARKAFDRVPETLVKAFDIDVIALGGYMSYITLRGCVNVHPADLSVINPDGTRKFVGDHAVRDAIAAGEIELRASTLWTDQGVDTGPLLMVSDPVQVTLPEPLETLRSDPARLARVADEHQNRLKEVGDWTIFPRTVEMIARGRFALNEQSRVYADNEPVPNGYRLT
ncbi:MAG: formyltransferase family protein [Desulfobacteraceae bacterium]|jgi:folate-dependent phosphoribosylglycinamide formyltransferase PurN